MFSKYALSEQPTESRANVVTKWKGCESSNLRLWQDLKQTKQNTTLLGNIVQNARETGTKTGNEKIWGVKKLCTLPHILSYYATQASCPSYFSCPCAAAGSQWQTDTQPDNRLTDGRADKPSLLIPVYSKWKPAADTLMSDWKVRNRLLDVLFSSWGIVVPALYKTQRTVRTTPSPCSKKWRSGNMWTCTTWVLHLTKKICSGGNTLNVVTILL